eukprot:GHVQ01041647.1.p1 GENE.GHVQ01041647.1~~GHVQ01041647.1.p1  ORF type:complete len:166 (+),score=17.05 GHVQ01041647.1:156-653(+)
MRLLKEEVKLILDCCQKLAGPEIRDVSEVSEETGLSSKTVLNCVLNYIEDVVQALTQNVTDQLMMVRPSGKIAAQVILMDTLKFLNDQRIKIKNTMTEQIRKSSSHSGEIQKRSTDGRIFVLGSDETQSQSSGDALADSLVEMMYNELPETAVAATTIIALASTN